MSFYYDIPHDEYVKQLSTAYLEDNVGILTSDQINTFKPTKYESFTRESKKANSKHYVNKSRLSFYLQKGNLKKYSSPMLTTILTYFKLDNNSAERDIALDDAILKWVPLMYPELKKVNFKNLPFVIPGVPLVYVSSIANPESSQLRTYNKYFVLYFLDTNLNYFDGYGVDEAYLLDYIVTDVLVVERNKITKRRALLCALERNLETRQRLIKLGVDVNKPIPRDKKSK